jgi:hypothetical protein
MVVVALHQNRGFSWRGRFSVAKSRTQMDQLQPNRGRNTGCRKRECYKHLMSSASCVGSVSLVVGGERRLNSFYATRFFDEV